MIYAGCFIIGVVIGYCIPKANSPINALSSTRHEDHLEPKYFEYNGGYANVTRCIECNLRGLYEDLHPARCCPRCGGKVGRAGSAKYGKHEGVYMWTQSNLSP